MTFGPALLPTSGGERSVGRLFLPCSHHPTETGTETALSSVMASEEWGQSWRDKRLYTVTLCDTLPLPKDLFLLFYFLYFILWVDIARLEGKYGETGR